MSSLGSLPRGHHGLSREEVESSQRTRLLQATIELGAERGLASLSLTDIVGRAGVARSSFYQFFADKHACFVAAMDHAADRVLEQVVPLGPPPSGDFAGPADAYIARMLDLALEEPGLVRMVVGNAEALGPVVAERQRLIRSRLADGLVALREYMRRDDPRMTPMTHLRALAVVGAISEVMVHTFDTMSADALPALRKELATVVLAIVEAPPTAPT